MEKEFDKGWQMTTYWCNSILFLRRKLEVNT